jgi:ribA/ribD-fused uncharacterized protein
MIDSFRGEYRFLSNFALVNVTLDRWQYPSVEHAYQAAKTIDLSERKGVQLQTTPGKAKRAGQKVTKRDDWERVRIDVMHDLLRQKFAQEPFRTQLLATANEKLIEGNTWGDTFWGVCEGDGQNWLGRLLMRVRTELRVRTRTELQA